MRENSLQEKWLCALLSVLLLLQKVVLAAPTHHEAPSCR